MAITNEEEFEAWLEEHSQPMRIAIAARASLRCYPAVLGRLDEKDFERLALLTSRAILTAAVAVPARSVDVMAAAYSAGSSIRSSIRSAASFADSFVLSASGSARSAAACAAGSITGSAVRHAAGSASGSAASFALSANYQDCMEIVRHQPELVFKTSLWYGDIAPSFKPAWDGFVLTSGRNWDFWKKWYQGFLQGAPLDWELQRRIALITDDIWDKGVAAVAEAIEAIEANYLRETTHAYEDPNDPGDVSARLSTKQAKLILTRTEVAQPLVQDPKTENFTLDRASAAPADPVAFAHESIQHALEHALDTSKPNALKSDDEEVQLLKFALETLPKEARHLGPAFHQVHVSLDAKFASGAYPDALATLHLCNQLKAHVSLFAESDPTVAKHIKIYGELAIPRSVSRDTADDLRNAGNELEDVLEQDAQDAIEQLADTIEAGKPPSKFEMAVLTHWLTQIGLYLDKAKKGEARFAWLVSLLKRLWDVWQG